MSDDEARFEIPALPVEIAERVEDANLPLNYERAKEALRECDKLDATSMWACAR